MHLRKLQKNRGLDRRRPSYRICIVCRIYNVSRGCHVNADPHLQRREGFETVQKGRVERDGSEGWSVESVEEQAATVVIRVVLNSVA